MIFKPSEIDRATTFISKLFERGKSVKIEALKEMKTLSQISYIHVVFADIADQCQGNMKDVKDHYKKQFPKYKEITFNGEIELVEISSLADFTKEQMSEFINEVSAEGANDGFRIPDPDEVKDKRMFEYYREKGII